MSNRIRWESDGKDGFEGYVGTLEPWLFQIHRPVLAGQGWVLAATFPGAFNDVRPGTPDELKAEAERWLEEFVSSLGAIFGDAVVADLRSRADETDSMVANDSARERDKLIFTAGMRRAADLIEHGDQPMANPEPAEEAAQ